MQPRFGKFVLAVCSAAAAWMVGCAGPTGPKFQPAVSDPQKAVLYVFRDSGGGLDRSAIEISINQQSAGQLRPGQYLVRSLPPGEYFVRAALKSNMVRALTLAGGDVAYLRVTTEPFDGKKPLLNFPEYDVARQMITNTTRVGE